MTIVRIPHLICAGLIALAAATPAAAAETRSCASADLRYPYEPGGPKTFGVFKLRITNGSCPLAHDVAERWMDRFEKGLRAGRVKLPRSVSGFAFRSLTPDEPQTYRLRGRRADTTIRFSYTVPNG